MFKLPPFSGSPPASVEDAAEQARLLLAKTGIEDAEVSVTQPPSAGESLRGACLEVTIPLPSLETALRKAAEAQAAAHGVKISGTHVRFENGPAGELSLRIDASLDVRVFGSTVTLRLGGLADAAGGEQIRFANLQLDAGSGLFSGMATALIRPYLDSVAGQPIDLTHMAGVPVRLLRMECPEDEPERLRLCGRFV